MNDTLKALVEAADKATPGPWKTEFNEKHGLSEYDVFSNTPHYQFVACHPSRISNPIAANMQFIVAARNAIPALRASLARDKAIEAYVANLRHEGDLNGLVQRTVDEEVEGRLKGVIADELQSLLEGRK